jgi:hypothetical protein
LHLTKLPSLNKTIVDELQDSGLLKVPLSLSLSFFPFLSWSFMYTSFVFGLHLSVHSTEIELLIYILKKKNKDWWEIWHKYMLVLF